MTERKLENIIVMLLECIFLTGRSIYLEYHYGSIALLAFISCCGASLILYTLGVWRKWYLEKKNNIDQ